MLCPFNHIFAKLWVRFWGREKLRGKRRIFIFGAFGGRDYKDNSAIFFEYMLSNHPEIDSYWVIRADAYHDHAKKGYSVPPFDRVLIKESFHANVMTLIANVIICSHGRYDVTDYRKSEFGKETVDVMLTHGIAALKKTKSGSAAGAPIISYATYADIVVASSAEEARIKNQEWGIPKEKIALTGLPRHDRLFYQRKNIIAQKNTILFMPTWRSWNADKTTLRGSHFLVQITAFIAESGLDSYLGRHGINMKIYIHMWMREFFAEFKQTFSLQNISILDQENDLLETMLKSSLLITDYSSVCWDFLFIDKPVLFYQFDIDEYLQHTGSYIDLKKDLFGPVAYNAEDAAFWVRFFVENNFSTERFQDKMDEMKKFAFAYNDGKNCERLFQAIFKRFS
ncbi:MAG: CDP-glycerol glycerophosphotransferase family protein [Synergistaceae bacterium]|nr:CDP-glycerol glycerophosphotransferase family protein [Synergistaceae bacterium]